MRLAALSATKKPELIRMLMQNGIRKGTGQMGSALMGSLQLSCFSSEGPFLGTPVNLLVSSQKCQGVPFPQSVKPHVFCSGPISVDPICPQPKMLRAP